MFIESESESSKHTLGTTDQSQRLSTVLQEREKIIVTMKEKLQTTQKQLTSKCSYCLCIAIRYKALVSYKHHYKMKLN